MVVAHAYTGASLPVDAYFEALRAIKQEKGVASQKISLGGRCVALQTDTAECGLDNGFNLLETALAPVDDGPDGLNRPGALAPVGQGDPLTAWQAACAAIVYDPQPHTT